MKSTQTSGIRRISRIGPVLTAAALLLGSGLAWCEPTPANLPKVDLNNFSRPTQIDNKWFPLKPGNRLVYEGTTIEDDGTAVPHRIVINVTDMTKVIGGVRTLATWDLDYSNNSLVEKELAFYAQDDDGTVWRVGEYPEEYEAGRFIQAPCWIHGLEGAQMGIQMRSNPRLGTPDYAQGWGPAVDWTDRGQIDRMGEKVKVPAGEFADVLVIAETSAAEPDAQQLKYHAPGIGPIKVGWRGAGEKTKETLELTRIEQLDAKAMDRVRQEALAMEQDGNRRSKQVYARLEPLEQETYVNGLPIYERVLLAKKTSAPKRRVKQAPKPRDDDDDDDDDD
ncbi:MAG: hypothetical protein KJ558_01385 [Gammaproteobacteria bacterium]|nr:hypothetical protein [Gammaproteobacteria bacterium]MBU1653489.1 hypothetical protein [Gammaproteobacteria bacterium]MBU1962730.1 hypothetical protein [Gammaproteobacteria bacterium]